MLQKNKDIRVKTEIKSSWNINQSLCCRKIKRLGLRLKSRVPETQTRVQSSSCVTEKSPSHKDQGQHGDSRDYLLLPDHAAQKSLTQRSGSAWRLQGLSASPWSCGSKVPHTKIRVSVETPGTICFSLTMQFKSPSHKDQGQRGDSRDYLLLPDHAAHIQVSSKKPRIYDQPLFFSNEHHWAIYRRLTVTLTNHLINQKITQTQIWIKTKELPKQENSESWEDIFDDQKVRKAGIYKSHNPSSKFIKQTWMFQKLQAQWKTEFG